MIASRAWLAFVVVLVGIMVDELFLFELAGFHLGALLGSIGAGFWLTSRLRRLG